MLNPIETPLYAPFSDSSARKESPKRVREGGPFTAQVANDKARGISGAGRLTEGTRDKFTHPDSAQVIVRFLLHLLKEFKRI